MGKRQDTSETVGSF